MLANLRRTSLLSIVAVTIGLFFLAACSPTSNTPIPAQAPSPTNAPTPVPQSTPLPAPSNVPAATTPDSPTATVAAAVPAAPSSADWTMYHYDNARTGYVPNLPDPRRLTVAWNTPLDGQVYAEPLVVGGHVLVATEGDSVYSLNAQTGQIEWHTKIGDPVPRSALPCGNISPLGITGTPIYDPASGLVFAVAEVTGPAHILVGVDVHSGAVRLRRPVDPPGAEPAPHQQRAALALSQGIVYVAYGGLYGDCGNYHGWIVGSRTDATGALLTYQVPTGREGGIWAPPGPVIDSAGRVFVSVGNGSETLGDWDHSDSILRLSPSLQLEDGFAPDRWRQDNVTDADLGSLGPVLMPGGMVLIAGKAGIGYVLRADALGGVGGQLITQSICHAYGGAAVVGSTAFLPCNEGLQQVQLTPGPSLNIGWRAQMPGSPVVGGQTVYSLDRSGTLYALDIATGRVRTQVNVGASTTRFATPTLSANRIFVGTTTGVTGINAQ